MTTPEKSFKLGRRPFLALAAAGLASPVRAQSWPDKPLRIIVPFAPGGPADLVPRVMMAHLSEILGHPVVVENKGGVGGNIGARLVAKAAPDGYTLMMTSSAFVVNTSIPNAGFNAEKDFIPVTVAASQPNVVVTHPSLPVNTLPELLALAKSDPLAFATPGMGTTPHLTGENLFNIESKLKMTAVHYKGAGQAVLGVLGGEPKVGCLAVTAPLKHIQAGKLKALAVSSAKRLALLPDVPTLGELGIAGMQDYTWIGAFLPAGTPAAIQSKWYEAIAKALAMPDVQAKLKGMAFDAVGEPPAKTAAYIHEEIAHWAKVSKYIGLIPS
jgi:tripartite-type tricarboxylate transporter receptor subunit TctC